MGKIGKAIAAIATTGVLAVSGSAPAFAADDPYDSVRQFWTTYDVPSDVQDALVDELQTTGLIDAVRLDSTPVSVRTITGDGTEQTVATFADGSVSVTSLDVPPVAAAGGIQPYASWGNCTTTSGSGWVHYANCEVVSDVGIYRMGFKVTYEKYAAPALAKIISTTAADAKSGTGTITDPTRSLWRPQSSATEKAVVKYHSEYTSYSGLTQMDAYLGFWLSYSGVVSLSTS